MSFPLGTSWVLREPLGVIVWEPLKTFFWELQRTPWEPMAIFFWELLGASVNLLLGDYGRLSPGAFGSR